MKSGNPFRFPLSFDPLRIILAIRDHWIPLLLLSVIGLGAGGALGYKIFRKDSYTVAAILNKSGEAEGKSFFGLDAWSPDILKDEALEQIAMSPNVLTKLGQLLDPPETVKQLEHRLKVEYNAAERLFYLTTKGPAEKAAIAIANEWSKIIVDRTKEYMRLLSEDKAYSLREDLKRLDLKLIPLNAKIQTLAEDNVIVDETTKFQILSTEIENLKNDLRAYEREDKTFFMRYNKALEALMMHHPLRSQYGHKMQELTLLRTRYTEQDDRVIKVQAEANLLKAQIDEKLTDNPTEEQILQCAGVEAAAPLYDRYLDLKDQQYQNEEGISSTQIALSEKLAEMSRLPGAAAAYRKVADERAQLLSSQDEFRQRLLYAEYYAGEQSPGYLKIFQPADWGLADLATGKLKTIACGILLGALACGMMLLWSVFREWRRPEMRTMLQAAITTRATPKFCLLQKDDLDDEEAIREFWLSQLSKSSGGRRILFPILGDLKSEFLFWKTLLQSIKRDNALVLFVDVAQEPVPDSFLRANLLPFTPPGRSRTSDSPNFLQQATSGSQGSEDMWKGATALSSGTDIQGDAGGTALATSTPTIPSIKLTDNPKATSALSTLLQPEDQPLIPFKGNVSQSARYVSAAEYSTEQLSRLLEDLPPHYYVLCRWAIGPTSSLASISKSFDQHFLLNSPMKSSKKVASSQSRIFRRILGVPSGILFLNEPTKGVFANLVHRIEAAYLAWQNERAPQEPTKGAPDSNQEL